MAAKSSIGRDLLIQSGPIDLVGEADQLVLHVDDLIETSFEEIVVIGFFLLFRSHQNPQKQCLQGITNRPKSESKSQGKDYQTATFLQL